MSISLLVSVPIVNGKKNPKVFLTRSENEEDVAAFLSPMHHSFVSEPASAGSSIEMSDSSNISSGSRVPVEVAKSWPWQTVCRIFKIRKNCICIAIVLPQLNCRTGF